MPFDFLKSIGSVIGEGLGGIGNMASDLFGTGLSDTVSSGMGNVVNSAASNALGGTGSTATGFLGNFDTANSGGIMGRMNAMTSPMSNSTNLANYIPAATATPDNFAIGATMPGQGGGPMQALTNALGPGDQVEIILDPITGQKVARKVESIDPWSLEGLTKDITPSKVLQGVAAIGGFVQQMRAMGMQEEQIENILQNYREQMDYTRNRERYAQGERAYARQKNWEVRNPDRDPASNPNKSFEQAMREYDQQMGTTYR